MQYFYAFVLLLSGLGVFMLGLRIVSASMEKKASGRLEALIVRSSSSKLSGVGLGAGASAVIQSSSIVTSMTVSMVSAGVIGLHAATAIIMGANIGTTVTAQIAALGSLRISEIAIILAFIGTVIYIAAKTDKNKALGYALAGLGLVFCGLKFMSDTMEVFASSQTLLKALSTFKNPLVLLIIGLTASAIIQSSSAINSIIISMAGAGITIGGGGNSALYVVLGTNIGTCLTAIITSAALNKDAKRAALINLLFNIFGAIVYLIILIPNKNLAQNTLEKWFKSPATQIAMFHTIQNLTTTIAALPLINALVKLSKILIKDKEKFSKPPTKEKENISKNPVSKIPAKGMENISKNPVSKPPTKEKENISKNPVSKILAKGKEGLQKP